MDERKHEELTRIIIGAAIEVHRILGPGLLESVYDTCLVYELNQQGLEVETQVQANIKYKNAIIIQNYKADIVIDKTVLLELKCVEKLSPLHKAQAITYMKLLNLPVGLLLNFHTSKMIDGISRVYLPEYTVSKSETNTY